MERHPQLLLTLFTQLDNDKVMRSVFDSFPQVSFSRLPIRAKIRPYRILAEQLLLPWYVARSKVDVLWSPGYTAPFYSSCPQAVTVHDLQYKRYPEDLTFLERFALDNLVRIACRKCRMVIAVSNFSKSEIEHFGFASGEKVCSILEGVERSFAEPVDDLSVVEELERLMMGEPYILSVAHSYPHKNLDMLISAFDLVQVRVPHKLVIVGKPRLGEPAVARAIGQMSSSRKLVRLTSGVSFDLLRLLYQRADLFVLPSGYEGFGLPVLEAMMAGCLVVSSPEASLPEVGGVIPLYMDELDIANLADKIEKALDLDGQDKKKRIEEGIKWASAFTWERAAKQTVAALSRLC